MSTGARKFGNSSRLWSACSTVNCASHLQFKRSSQQFRLDLKPFAA